MFLRIKNFIKSPLFVPVYVAAGTETIFISFFTMLPILVGLLYLKITSTYKGLQPFYQQGEFFLYSLSLYISAYMVFNQYKLKPWDLNSAFSKVSLTFLVLCSILYAILATTSNPDIAIIEFFSILSMAIAIPMFYYAQVVSNHNSPDVAEVRKSEQETIMDSLS